jgi:hypothetical protein
MGKGQQSQCYHASVFKDGRNVKSARKENPVKEGFRPKLTCVGLVIACLVVAVSLTPLRRVKADGSDGKDDSRIEIGFAIAPVHLNMKGKNPKMVGLGSYLVNLGGCADCHSAGSPTEYSPGQNPYFGQPKHLNPAVYLGGGRDLGPLVPGSYDIVSRNLTPDKSGLPEGGATFEQFLHTIRTGIDDDHLHPPCAPGTVASNCIPAPFDGNLLQIMPWPFYQELTDGDIRAIYEYLSAVPCVEGNYPADQPNRCG